MKFFLTIVLYLFILEVQAQFSENHAIYMSPGFRAGNFRGASLNLNYVYQEKHSVQFGWSYFSSKPANRPENYLGGILDLATYGFSSPRNRVTTRYVLFGRMIHLNADQNIRLNLRAGPSWDMISTPENFKPIGINLINSNYSYDIFERKSLGFVIRPEVEFPFTQVLGLGVGTFLHVNRDFFVAGVEMNLMLGLLRKKRNQPHATAEN